MRFKIDENLPQEVADELRARQHEADTVADENLSGEQDEKLLRVVRDEQRVFLTMDKGIANIRDYPPADYHGIVLFRPPSQGRGIVFEFVRDHLDQVLRSPLDGRLIVVSASGIRVR
jgi:hypothetical protein